MADVDKALNTTPTVEVPKEEEVLAVQEQIKENVENKDNVIHVIAGALYEYSSALADLRVQSHDFH